MELIHFRHKNLNIHRGKEGGAGEVVSSSNRESVDGLGFKVYLAHKGERAVSGAQVELCPLVACLDAVLDSGITPTVSITCMHHQQLLRGDCRLTNCGLVPVSVKDG